MSKSKIPAKDLAFAKEKLSWKKQYNKMELQIKQKEQTIQALNIQLSEKDDIIRSQNEWIQRLLEYMDLSEDDFTKIKQNLHQEKCKEAIMTETIQQLFQFFH